MQHTTFRSIIWYSLLLMAAIFCGFKALAQGVKMQPADSTFIYPYLMFGSLVIIIFGVFIIYKIIKSHYTDEKEIKHYKELEAKAEHDRNTQYAKDYHQLMEHDRAERVHENK